MRVFTRKKTEDLTIKTRVSSWTPGKVGEVTIESRLDTNGAVVNTINRDISANVARLIRNSLTRGEEAQIVAKSNFATGLPEQITILADLDPGSLATAIAVGLNRLRQAAGRVRPQEAARAQFAAITVFELRAEASILIENTIAVIVTRVGNGVNDVAKV